MFARVTKGESDKDTDTDTGAERKRWSEQSKHVAGRVREGGGGRRARAYANA